MYQYERFILRVVLRFVLTGSNGKRNLCAFGECNRDRMEAITMNTQTPYRIAVAAKRYFPVGRMNPRTGFTKMTLREFAYDLWTPTQSYQEARLPSAGSFLFPGIHAVRRAAMHALALPGVTQVQVRTNQDRIVYLWNRSTDGCISGYGYTKQEWRERM